MNNGGDQVTWMPCSVYTTQQDVFPLLYLSYHATMPDEIAAEEPAYVQHVNFLQQTTLVGLEIKL